MNVQSFLYVITSWFQGFAVIYFPVAWWDDCWCWGYAVGSNVQWRKGCVPFVALCYLPAYLPTYLPVYLPTTYLSTYLSIYLPVYLPVYLPTYLSIYLPTYLPVYLPVYLPTCTLTYLSTYLPTYLPTYVSIYIYLPIYLFISIYLSSTAALALWGSIDCHGFYVLFQIVRFNPHTGAVISIVEFPVSKVTSSCWAGPNYDELLVTSERRVYRNSCTTYKCTVLWNIYLTNIRDGRPSSTKNLA